MTISLFSNQAKALLLVGLVASAGSAFAERRVYAGSEVQALSCARMISTTAVVMEGEGYLGTRDMEAMLLLAGLILDRYVSGTDDQKFAAMDTLADRSGLIKTLTDFERHADWCLRNFPV